MEQQTQQPEVKKKYPITGAIIIFILSLFIIPIFLDLILALFISRKDHTYGEYNFIFLLTDFIFATIIAFYYYERKKQEKPKANNNQRMLSKDFWSLLGVGILVLVGLVYVFSKF